MLPGGTLDKWLVHWSCIQAGGGPWNPSSLLCFYPLSSGHHRLLTDSGLGDFNPATIYSVPELGEFRQLLSYPTFQQSRLAEILLGDCCHQTECSLPTFVGAHDSQSFNLNMLATKLLTNLFLPGGLDWTIGSRHQEPTLACWLSFYTWDIFWSGSVDVEARPKLESRLNICGLKEFRNLGLIKEQGWSCPGTLGSRGNGTPLFTTSFQARCFVLS